MKIHYAWGYLAAFMLGLFWECYAMLDNNPDTITLTGWTITHVPPYITLPFLVLVSGWTIHHFYSYYKKIIE